MLRLKGVAKIGLTALGGIVLGVSCSQAPSPKAPEEARPTVAASPAMETAQRAPGQPSSFDEVSSQPKTLKDAEASFAAAEHQVVALVGTAEKPQALSTDSCGVACKALASMKRATSRLCELATDEPDRCDDAKGRLDRATTRVRDVCGECPATDG